LGGSEITSVVAAFKKSLEKKLRGELLI